MLRNASLLMLLVITLCIAAACEERSTAPTAPTVPRQLVLSGEIELVGPDQLTDFIGCLDNKWLGSYSGSDHSNSGHGRIRLATTSISAENARVQPGRHEFAVVISGPIGPNSLYFTETPAFINVVEPETGRTLDSRNVVGRHGGFAFEQAFGWLLTIDEMGRIVGFTETMLTRDEVLARHGRCIGYSTS